MTPLICSSDLVDVEPVTGPPTPGTIVVGGSRARDLVCHRVLRVLPNGDVLMAGDHSTSIRRVPAAELTGVVRAVSRDERCLILSDGLLQRVSGVLATWRRLSCDGEMTPRSRAGLSAIVVSLARHIGLWVVGRMMWCVAGRLPNR